MRWGPLLTGGMLCLLATALRAQTVTLPDLPPEPEPEPSPVVTDPQSGPPPLVESDERSRGGWEYELGLSLLWDSNITFRESGTDDGTAVPHGSVARTFVGPRARLRLEADGRWFGYVHQSDFNRAYGEFSLDGAYDSSPRTHWRTEGSFVLGHSDFSQPLVEQGVLLPLVETRTLTGFLGMSQDLGSRTQLRIDGRIYRTEFDDALWIDGQSIRGSLGLEHQLGARDSVGVVYALENVVAYQEPRISYLTHYGSLQWTRILSSRTGLTLEGGASYTPTFGDAALDRRTSFFGGVSVSRQVKDSYVTAFVRREVAPAFGTGLSRLETRGGLTMDVALGRSWSLRATGLYVLPEGAAVAGLYSSSIDSSLELARRWGRHFEIAGEALYRRRDAAGVLAMVDAVQAGVSFRLASPRPR